MTATWPTAAGVPFADTMIEQLGYERSEGNGIESRAGSARNVESTSARFRPTDLDDGLFALFTGGRVAGYPPRPQNRLDG
mgnify:CR=1 FL=1